LSNRNWWKKIKLIAKLDSKIPSIPSIKSNDTAEKAELFNNYFSAQSQINDENTPLPNLSVNQNYLQIVNVNITPNDVKHVLLTLNISKAIGPDLIHPRLLKEASDC